MSGLDGNRITTDRASPSAAIARRILIVDDNEEGLALLADALRFTGHEVQTARDGAGALELVRRYNPEVAVLDIGLPDLDGYELASRLRGELAPTRLWLIALTGYGHKLAWGGAIESAFDRYFVKPVDVEALIDSISVMCPHTP